MSDARKPPKATAKKAAAKRTAAKRTAAKPAAKRTVAKKSDAAPDRRPPAGRSSSGRRRSLDPQGRRALFETPVSAARDTIRSGNPSEGKAALYSTGPRQTGTVVVSCGACDARTRINIADLGLRWLTGTIWIPGRRQGHWMRCPSCHKRTCCSVGWQD